jgi:hypothetical protein
MRWDAAAAEIHFAATPRPWIRRQPHLPHVVRPAPALRRAHVSLALTEEVAG